MSSNTTQKQRDAGRAALRDGVTCGGAILAMDIPGVGGLEEDMVLLLDDADAADVYEAVEGRLQTLVKTWGQRATDMEAVAAMVGDPGINVSPAKREELRELATMHDQAACQIRICAKELRAALQEK